MNKYRNYSDEESLYTQDYMDHVQAMTAEKLHSKSEIAAELAGRDREIEQLKAHNEELQHYNVGLAQSEVKLRAERDQLKVALLRFLTLDGHDPDLKDDLWCLQQEESPLINQILVENNADELRQKTQEQNQ